jgi:hypothetical protein
MARGRIMAMPSESRTAAASAGPPTYVLVMLSRRRSAADQTGMKAECVEWKLVGVNPDAIDASVTIRSRDV